MFLKEVSPLFKFVKNSSHDSAIALVKLYDYISL